GWRQSRGPFTVRGWPGRLRAPWGDGDAAKRQLRKYREVSLAYLVAASAGAAVGAAVAAGILVLAVGALWLAVSRRTHSAPTERWLSTVVTDLEARIDAMQREV